MSVNLLGQASDALDDAVDLEVALESVARLTVPALADFCAIDVLSPGGTLARVAVPRGLGAPLARSVEAWFPADPKGPHPIARVLREGHPEVVSAPGGAREADAPRAEARVPAPSSYLVVPLVARGYRLGVLSLVSWTPARPYRIDDLRLAGWLARQLALAVDNRRLCAAIGEFLVGLSHELRTPLTAMLGWVTLLRRHDLSPSQVNRALEVLERNTRLQARVLDQFLEWTRLPSGPAPLRWSPGASAASARGTTAAAPDVPATAGAQGTPDSSEPGASSTSQMPQRPDSSEVEPASIAGCRVLVIEDDLDTREFLRLILEQRGAVVRVAESAAGGLGLLEGEPVDVVLSDLMLPDGDGWSVVRAIRARGLTRLPAVALSALSGPADRAGSAAAGFAEHLVKPVEPEHLVRCLARLVRQAAS